MTAPKGPPERPPGATTLAAGGALIRRRVRAELGALPIPMPRAKPPGVQGFSAAPLDLRPADPAAGRAMLRGSFVLAGATLEVGAGGDPWGTPSPSRKFAVQLHRFAWIRDLLERGEPGAAEALRLTLLWLALFDRPQTGGAQGGFASSAEVLERRVFNLACSAAPMLAAGTDGDAHRLADSLARQTRCLAALDESPGREAERLAAASVAAVALAARAGSQLLGVLLPRLGRALQAAVLPDGGLRTRSPRQVLELLFDLRTLDEALLQRGREAPDALSRAIERLSGAARFFTLGDGVLASFHGGESASAGEVGAALARDPGEARPYSYLPQSGYHRLSGRMLQLIVDTGPPAPAGWSEAACAQPLALEVAAGRDRLFANTGWSPDALGPQALRLSAAGNTLTLGESSPGRPLNGWRADGLGPRLSGGAERVEARRNESEAGIWLETSHDGWVRSFGLVHERRLFLDGGSDELRGEDRLAPASRGRGAWSPEPVPYAIRFHVPPEVRVSLALDGRSVLLQGPSNRRWWFRNDAPEVALEPSAHFRHGLPQRSVQLVLRGSVKPGGEARVRWKLTPVEAEPTASPEPDRT